MIHSLENLASSLLTHTVFSLDMLVRVKMILLTLYHFTGRCQEKEVLLRSRTGRRGRTLMEPADEVDKANLKVSLPVAVMLLVTSLSRIASGDIAPPNPVRWVKDAPTDNSRRCMSNNSELRGTNGLWSGIVTRLTPSCLQASTLLI
jgi:hypothetical protein